MQVVPECLRLESNDTNLFLILSILVPSSNIVYPSFELRYKIPVLHKLPWLGKKLFTSNGIIERKTDLIIQITPKIIQDEYTGITKSARIKKFEDYVIEDAMRADDEKSNLKPVNDEGE